MANNNPDTSLDTGFEEMPLDKGFEPVPLSDNEKAALVKHLNAPQATAMQSMREGLAQGGTFGFAPRMGAALGAGLETVAGTSPDKKLQDLYNEYLDYNNKLQAKAKASNPGLYTTAELAGGIASPLNKIGAVGALGKAAPEASMLAKMAHSTAAGAKMGALGGLSQSQDLSNLPQDVSQMGKGMVFGAGVGAAAPPVTSALSSAAGAGANVLKSVFGPVGQNISTGLQAGMEGTPNLASEAGQQQAQGIRKDFADNFVNDLKNIIKSSAKDKVAKIAAKTEDVSPEQLDPIIQKYLESNPKLNTPEAAAELQRLKNMILTAKEGPLKTETVRQYMPGQAPVLPSNTPPVPIGQVQRMPASAEPGALAPNPDVSMLPQQPQLPPGPNEPPPSSSGPEMAQPPEAATGFGGYKKVFATTVDKDDKEALQAFHQKVMEREADERMIPGSADQEPIEVVPEEIEGYPDKVRLVARRQVIEQPSDEFADQAKSAQQPQFQDVQQTVREGGRNIYNPSELYNLQQLMSGMSQFREGRGFSSDDVTKMAGNVAQDIQNVIKSHVGTGDIDSQLHAFNNIAEVLGIDASKLSVPGGVGEKAQNDAMNKLFKLINPENLNDQTLLSQDKLQYIDSQLRNINPDLADQFIQNATKQAESKGLMKEFSKPYEPSGINWLFNAVRKNASKAAYGAGYNLGQQVTKVSNEITPSMQAGQKIFTQFTPDSLQQAASKAASSADSTVQQFGQVLSKLAGSDERTRNSMLFVLQQNPGYRDMMKNLISEEPKQSTQMKDNTLQKFK